MKTSGQIRWVSNYNIILEYLRNYATDSTERTLFVDLSSTSLPSLLPSFKPAVSKTIKYLCRCFFRKEICVTWEESNIMQDDLLDCLIYLLWWQSIFHCVCYVDIAMYINVYGYPLTAIWWFYLHLLYLVVVGNGNC